MSLNEAITVHNLVIEMSTEKGTALTRAHAADHGPVGETRRDGVIGRGVMGSQAGQKQAASKENRAQLETRSDLTQWTCKMAASD